MTRFLFVFLMFFVFPAGLSAEDFPEVQEHRLGNAKVSVSGSILSVSTGKVERKWKLNGYGLRTVSFRDLSLGKEWCASYDGEPCDWNIPKIIPHGAIPKIEHIATDAELVSVSIRKSDDEGFLNPFLEVVTHFRYDSARLEIQHVVWVFPDAPGIRTQLRVKAMEGFKTEGISQGEFTINYYGNTKSIPSARAEYLPLDYSIENHRRYWGYYNDPGNRHDQSKDMLKEFVVNGYPLFQNEDIHWASGISTEYGPEGDKGVIVVKESHKCVNQQGHYTGSFYAGPRGLCVTGWGLTPEEIVTDRFRECWATWTIAFAGGNDGMQLALKRFDRCRYPVFPKRDIMLINDTWGPANPGGGQFAREEHLLKEIPLLGELGIDVLRIDDGWQTNPWKRGQEVFLPRYPDKWKNISAACRKADVDLGLWVAIRRAKQEDLLWNLKEAGVVTWKIDFDKLITRENFENRFKSIREIMKAAWMKTQFTFCPEYSDPRYGWYYAKEYGSIYFQNIQEAMPEHLIMVPYHILRQHWLMSKYLNSNKVQVLLQNPKRVDRRYSDAFLHSHDYCFAMGLPFVPVFFQSAQFLDEEGREELKTLISIYKSEREKMFGCYSFPIGEKPDNASWAGFQFIDDTSTEGYLLVFREMHNLEAEKKIRLMFLSGKKLQVTDLRTGKKEISLVDKEGNFSFRISDPADFCYLKYRIMD